MRLKNLRSEWLQFLILAGPFCVVVLLWDKLPYWVPIHWNAHGEVDGYERKALGTLLLPTVNVVLALGLALLPLIDPKLQKFGAEMKAGLWRTIKIFRIGFTGFLSLVSLGMLAEAMQWFNGGKQFILIIYVGMALLFILSGNFLTRLRQNYFIGIRTPWTLESREVWMKTHRMIGRAMVAGGCLMLVLCFLVPLERYVFFVFVPVIGGISLFSILYSYFLYRKQRASKPV